VAACPACGKENPDGFQFCGFCAAPLTGESREQRKTVTVLFCDVTGSTALGESTDPEALRALLARYFERMKAIVESHGGSVEKFIGDAVMAVFGVPVVHEDDALRACRAAVEMRGALPELGVLGRIGVTTGEVVTGTAERLATGDPVNTAARLEQAAQPGEVLIGEPTLKVARDAVEVEVVESLALKGKAEAVIAYRLVSVNSELVEGVSDRLGAPMVGRERERDRLRDAFDQAVSSRSCQLFTLLGAAGVGKSRLTAEFLGSVDDALVVRGRCLPYGEGITYWPVVEVIKQLPVVEMDRTAAATIGGLVGDEQMVSSSEEIAWAFRKLLEVVASETPVVCVFDDVHWGEETFLDLIEHVADLARDAPILLLCMARSELLDRRTAWGGGKVNATSVLLEPLAANETERLIESLADVDEDLRERIVETSEGNPLFVEEMVAFAQEIGDREVTVPPTIQALLAARLDQLDISERGVLERGAVEGRIFHRGAVQALAPEEQQLSARLISLVRKELVRPDKPQLPGEDAFRFRHLLIRDAAYDALPKATRSELHQRFAVWLEAYGQALVEIDEILGYHLEQAFRYQAELGTPDLSIGARAGERLAAAGRRAFDRGDMPAAALLLERAVTLLPSDDRRRASLLPSLGKALIERGEWEQARARLAEAVEAGENNRELRLSAEASVDLCYMRLHTDPEASHETTQRELEAAISVFEELEDEAGLARALTLAALLPFWAGQASVAFELLERAAFHARQAGDRVQETQTLRYMLAAAFHGPTPVQVVLELIDDVSRHTMTSQVFDVNALRFRAELEAMQGRFESARDLIEKAKALAEQAGLANLSAAGVANSAGEIELLAGDPAAAERELRRGCEALEEMGDWGHLATLVPYLADALLEQGRGEEALPTLDAAAARVIGDDIDAQVGLRRVRARIIAQHGHFEQAERLSHEATELSTPTDYLNAKARAHCDRAEVLLLAGEQREAAATLEQAIEFYEQKNNLVMAERTRARLQELK
jgi:class 3 adenylate cyclase/tetratricopeptide (TPR) repeat protein